MTNDDYSKVPPPHLLKKFSEQARVDSQKRGHAGYCKTFAKLCIDWALNSKPSPNDCQIMSSDITPPPEMFAEWLAKAKQLHPRESTGFIAGEVARLAYQAGADQELEACVKLLELSDDNARDFLYSARRPKPPSLKEKLTVALYNEDIGTALRLVRQLDD